jgi:mannose/fructose/N-acetylgalactosamine-specific phosphotransferase system component IIC
MEEQLHHNSIAVAEEPAAPPKAAEEAPRESRALMIGIAGWLLPGLGHALQFMWGRAVVVFLAVGLLVGAGASMRGNVFTHDGGDAFDKLGYIADLGTGTFYVIARALEKDGSDVSHADGDYGTRLLATAGVLNLLAALHAYEAARGRKA